MADADQSLTEAEAGHRAEVEVRSEHTDAASGTLGALPIEPRTEPHVASPTHPTRAVRLPQEHDPAPQHGRMLILSAGAALLVLLGLVAAARVFAAILLNTGPGWLVPVTVTIGILGVAAAGVAFASIHRATLAFAALGASAAALAINLALVLVFL